MGYFQPSMFMFAEKVSFNKKHLNKQYMKWYLKNIWVNMSEIFYFSIF